MWVLRAYGGCKRLVRTLSNHVCDALAVVAFLWLWGQATLLGMVIQTSTVITAANDKKKKFTIKYLCGVNLHPYFTVFVAKNPATFS